jgi:hypothetical protein
MSIQQLSNLITNSQLNYFFFKNQNTFSPSSPTNNYSFNFKNLYPLHISQLKNIIKILNILLNKKLISNNKYTYYTTLTHYYITNYSL